MFKLLENDSPLVKIWLVIAMTALFIITLPLFLLALPFVAAYQLADHIYKPKQKKNRQETMGINPDIFDLWFSGRPIGFKKEGEGQ